MNPSDIITIILSTSSCKLGWYLRIDFITDLDKLNWSFSKSKWVYKSTGFSGMEVSTGSWEKGKRVRRNLSIKWFTDKGNFL